MEIIGTNLSEKEQKNRKLMKIIIIMIIILMLISAGLGAAIYVLKIQQFKLAVDGKIVSKSNNVFVVENGQMYFSIKDMASIVDYKFYNGGYKQYSEDTDKCYVENDNEVATFQKGSNKIYKTEPNVLDYEYITINEPVKIMSDGKLYTTEEGIERACNIDITYNEEKNQLTIYTLPYLAKYYTTNYKKAAVAEKFKNQKALLYGLMVVQDTDRPAENTQATSTEQVEVNYGVYSIDGKNEIIGTKYADIEFIESTEEFLVKTAEGKVGIITSDGQTKVKPQYDSLKQIYKDLNLYLATNNEKKGVIEKNGKILIYLEYDEIGIDATDFPTNDIKNQYVLFDNAIPVKQNGKWGMFNIKGNMILPLEYDGIGCISGTSTDKTANNTLIIPDLEAIVVSKIYQKEEGMEYNKPKIVEFTNYGIVNSRGKELVPVALDSVYSVTNNGRDEYSMIYQNTKYDILEYIRQYVDVEKLNKETENENTQNTQNTENTNTITNEITEPENTFTNVVNAEV